MYALLENTAGLYDARTALMGVMTPLTLAMQKLELSGKVFPTGGVITMTHSFRCDNTDPMEAVYVFQLPKGGAVRRFKMKGDGFEVDSKLSPRQEARKEYEAGVSNGHVSALTETSLDGLVTLNVGQVQPKETIVIAVEIVVGVETRDDGFRFRFPFTLAPNYHSGSKVSITPGGSKMEPATDVFGDLILPEFKASAKDLHKVSFRLQVEAGGPVGTVSSPSHNVTFKTNKDGSCDVWLASLSDHPDRDLVIDVTPQEIVPQVFADESITIVGRPLVPSPFPSGAPHWAVSIPSDRVPQMAATTKRVCFLVDTSGSMTGDRIARAVAAIEACLSALDPTDEFGIVQFESSTKVFHKKTCPANTLNRTRAAVFLSKMVAGGGTDLPGGLSAAIDVLDAPGYDIFLITDGEVGETGPIIEQMSASGTRVHVLGVGEAAQDRFLSALSRRSDGVNRTVNTQEDVAEAALDLFNAVRTPRQKNLTVEIETAGCGGDQFHTVETVWNGRAIILTDNGTQGLNLPIRAKLKLPGGDVDVDLTQAVRPLANGVIALAWAGQQVEDLEAAIDMCKDGPGRKSTEMALTKVSTDYGLASRVMSLVAVHQRVGDQAGVDPKQTVVAVGMPRDRQANQSQAVYAVNSVFGSSAAASLISSSYSMNTTRANNVLSYSPPSTGGLEAFGGASCYVSSTSTGGEDDGTTMRMISDEELTKGGHWDARGGSKGVLRSASASANPMKGLRGAGGQSVRTRRMLGGSSPINTPIQATSSEVLMNAYRAYQTTQPNAGDIITNLALIEADGGLPGTDLDSRVTKTALFCLALLANNTSRYKAHLRRMSAFLEANVTVADFLPRLISAIKAGKGQIQGDWLETYLDASLTQAAAWTKIRSACQQAGI